MKKTFAVFILLIFAFNIIGMYVPFYLVRSFIRHEMNERAKEEIRDEYLVELTFMDNGKPKGFTWTREGEEFKYGNEMYDVVKAERKGDKVVYYCLHDNEETNLNHIFNVLVKKEKERDNRANINLQKELSKFNISTNLLITPSLQPAIKCSIIQYSYKSLLKEVSLPPPKSTAAV